MKCEKCEKEGKAYALRWKSSKMQACFWTPQNAKMWSFLKMTTRFICFARHCYSLSYSSFSTWTSRRWGCIYALSYPFSRQALALPSSLPSQLLPFWRRDKETASTATALRKINLRKRVQLFGAFLSVTPQPSNREPSLQDYKALGNYLVHVYPRESRHCRLP